MAKLETDLNDNEIDLLFNILEEYKNLCSGHYGDIEEEVEALIKKLKQVMAIKT